MRRLGAIELAAVAAEVVGVDRAAALAEEPAATRFRRAVDAQQGAGLAEAVAGLLRQLLTEPPLPEVAGRVAVLATAQLAALNDDRLDLSPPEDAARFVADVAAGEVEPDKVQAWVRARLSRPHHPFPDVMEAPMFKRFTARAKAALTNAESAARSMQHGYVGTEHLLIGILRDRMSVGGKALTTLGLTEDAVRSEVLHRVGEGPEAPGARLPFTPRCKHAMEHALKEALALGHNYIGTEHLALGLTHDPGGIAAQVMAEAGITASDLRHEVMVQLTGRASGGPGAATTAGGAGGDPERIFVDIVAGDPSAADWRRRADVGTSGPACARCDAPFPERLGADRVEVAGLDRPAHIVHCRTCGATVTVLAGPPGAEG